MFYFNAYSTGRRSSIEDQQGLYRGRLGETNLQPCLTPWRGARYLAGCVEQISLWKCIGLRYFLGRAMAKTPPEPLSSIVSSKRQLDGLLYGPLGLSRAGGKESWTRHAFAFRRCIFRPVCTWRLCPPRCLPVCVLHLAGRVRLSGDIWTKSQLFAKSSSPYSVRGPKHGCLLALFVAV